MSDPILSAAHAVRTSGLRVVTLNLWGRSGVWADRRLVLIDGLRDLQPDLVAFVESIKTNDYDQQRICSAQVITSCTSQTEERMVWACRSPVAGPWQRCMK